MFRLRFLHDDLLRLGLRVRVVRRGTTDYGTIVYQMQAPSTDSTEQLASQKDAPALRLVEGMMQAVAEKRYADITVADVVRHARVSKRTFYEHFSDKEACFLATYQAVSHDLLTRIARAAASEQVGAAQLEAATHAYFSRLAEHPEITRAFLSEIQAAGPSALAMRRRIHGRFADLLVQLAALARRSDPAIRPLTREMAMALVGGINELVLLHLDEAQPSSLTQLTKTTTELVGLVLIGTTAPASPKPHKAQKARR